MGGLFKSSQPKVIPEFTGLQVNTAVQVLPIPIIYGCPRLSVNLIYYNGFQVKQVNVGGGGKGILSSGKGGSKEVEYFATIVLALCEAEPNGQGPILIIYQDQGVYTPSDYPSPGLNYFNGAAGQLPWSYVETTWPADARAYPFTATINVANAQLDSSATVPQINVVLRGTFSETCPLNKSSITITSGQYDQNGHPISFLGTIDLGYADADPARCIFDFLTNTTYGAGFPVQFIDASIFSTGNATNLSVGDASFQTYCQAAAGIGWSVVINNAESANSIIERWTKNLVTAPVWTGETLKFIPYWDTPSQTNPGYGADNPLAIPPMYFVPNTTPIVKFTLDFIEQAKNKEEDPITFSRVDPMLVYNTVRVDFRDRNNFFNDNPVEAKDEANVEDFGIRVDNIGLANEYTFGAYANASAQMQLQRNISIRRNFTFRLGPLWAFLDPMDIIQIPDPANWSNTLTVRIVSCEDDEDEITTYTCEEFTGGSESPTFIPISATTPPNQGITNIPAPSVFTPVIFEPTTTMLTAQGIASPQVITGVSGGENATFDPVWGGCFVWVSLNNVDYQQIGTITGPSAIGVLSTTLPTYGGSNPDNTDILAVNMNESAVALPSYSVAAAAGGASLCIVQGGGTWELLSYTTATLTATNQYNLTGLYRGLYSTTSRTFANGSQFLFLGFPTFLETAVPPQYVGQTFWVKYQSFNTYGQGVQSLADCVAYQYVVTGPVSPPVPPAFPFVPQRSRIVRPTEDEIEAVNRSSQRNLI